jgi:peptide/nickel transport system permease protein
VIGSTETGLAEGHRPSAWPARTQLLRVFYHPITRKIGRSFLVAVGVMLLSFAVMRLAPGDPALALVGDNATPADIEAMRDELGLNGTIPQQLWDYVWPLLHGDLGLSIISGQPVADLLVDSMPVTLSLITFAMILSLAFSLLLAVPTAKHRFGVPGLSFRVLTSVSLSLPVFFTGLVLILVFAIQLGWLPVGGYVPTFPENLRYLLLPAITACGPLVPVLLRVLQSSVVDTMDQAFVETAQVRGLAGPLLTWRYLLRPSLAPTIALSSYIVGTLFGSAVVLELVFNLPGVGTRLLNAVFARDYPVVQGIVFVIGILVVLINLLADLAIGRLDPRAKGAE